MAQSSQPSPSRPRGNLLSNVFLALAVVFALIAIALFVRGPGFGGVAPVPTAAAGGNQIVNVTDALRGAGLTVEQPPGAFVPAGALPVPGQGITIDGAPAYVFLFRDAAEAEAAAQSDPGMVVPETLRGTPTAAGERRLTQASNVLLVMVGGSAETWQKVETAVASLP